MHSKFIGVHTSVVLKTCRSKILSSLSETRTGPSINIVNFKTRPRPEIKKKKA